MILQRSFDETTPTLYVVATPIGNRDEMTPRAIAVLKDVDVIACEDTRTSGPLLAHFGIETKKISYHKHNERSSAEGILSLLSEGKSVALISDAGYPLISDPGYILVDTVTQAGYPVVPISGSSAFLNALVASGLDTMPFTFCGFLEHKDQAMRNQLNALKDRQETLIFYVSVHRVEKSLALVRDVLGDRNICLARELTKRYESFLRGTISEVIEALDTLKGEFVLVIEGQSDIQVTEENYLELVDQKIAEGLSPSRAIAAVAKEKGLSKNVIYQEYMSRT
ncbi:16S rRNA methyltransferase [Erysipelothrix larvae]|uniref:Ribosomal RNA small subunit methyltransferase I n=1 Tax=Erysipelothrix larvae TaxID=1514105 RepID=A0A120JU10_9FIRM|nr:16S rRNA (cytidine(1402)-2'-O)-methyltransferase [Erysipelothrix larvae]AMC94560.1 16S rRNA methyltransferase [Erysipelothrix larvae]